MSGVFLTDCDEPIDAVVSSMQAGPAEVVCDLSVAGALRGGLTRRGPRCEWAPARDAASGVVFAVLGRFVPAISNRNRDSSQDYHGGAIPAGLLALWQDDPVSALKCMNGACAWLILDAHRRTLEVVTDRLGIQPLYVLQGANFMLGSEVDPLAAYARSVGQTPQPDLVSRAEMLATGRVTQPFTYYEGVEGLEAATHYRWNLDQLKLPPQVHTYWRPGRDEDAPTLNNNDAIEAMVEALRGAMRRRQRPGHSAPTLLLSGGLDSRAILFAAPEPSGISCVTFCDTPNAETRTAAQIAAVAGAGHTVWRRDPDHYAAGARETVRWSGGSGSIAEGHFAGFGERWYEYSDQPLLSGCYADYLLKGLALNRGYKMFLGRRLPERTLGSYADEFYKDHVSVAPDLETSLRDRLRTRYEASVLPSDQRHALAIADLRIRPLAREADCAGRLWLLRHMDWDPVFADSDIVELYGRLTVAQVLNGEIFARAVRLLSPPAASRIRDNNTQGTVGASLRRRNLEFMVAKAGRKLRALFRGRKEPNSGSWPDMRRFIPQSKKLYELWMSVSRESRAQISRLLGSDPWDKTPARWGVSDSVGFLRILTLGLWLDQVQSPSADASQIAPYAATASTSFPMSRSDR